MNGVLMIWNPTHAERAGHEIEQAWFRKTGSLLSGDGDDALRDTAYCCSCSDVISVSGIASSFGHTVPAVILALGKLVTAKRLDVQCASKDGDLVLVGLRLDVPGRHPRARH